jgi:hypothetical protein
MAVAIYSYRTAFWAISVRCSPASFGKTGLFWCAIAHGECFPGPLLNEPI